MFALQVSTYAAIHSPGTHCSDYITIAPRYILQFVQEICHDWFKKYITIAPRYAGEYMQLFTVLGPTAVTTARVISNFFVRFEKFSVRFESQISKHTSPQGDVCD